MGRSDSYQYQLPLVLEPLGVLQHSDKFILSHDTRSIQLQLVVPRSPTLSDLLRRPEVI